MSSRSSSFGFVMQFIGGAWHQEYVAKTRGLDPAHCPAVGIDVGKYEVLCLIADHRGQIVGSAVTFALTEPGVTAVEQQVRSAAVSRAAVSIRIGVETAGRSPQQRVDALAA